MESQNIDVSLNDDELFTLVTDSVANSHGESGFCSWVSRWCQTHEIQWCREADSKMWYDLCIRLNIPVQYQEVVSVLKTRNRTTDTTKLIVTPSDQPTTAQTLDDMDIDKPDDDASNEYKFFTYRGNSFRRILYSHCRDLQDLRSFIKMIRQYCAALRQVRSLTAPNTQRANDLRNLILANLELMKIQWNPIGSDELNRTQQEYLKQALRSACEFDSAKSILSIVEELLITMHIPTTEWNLSHGVRNIVSPVFDPLHRDIGRQHAFKIIAFLTSQDLQLNTFKLMKSSYQFVQGWVESTAYSSEADNTLQPDQLFIIDQGYPLVSDVTMTYLLLIIGFKLTDPIIEEFQSRKSKVRVFTDAVNTYLNSIESTTLQQTRVRNAFRRFLHKAIVEDEATYSKFLIANLYVHPDLEMTEHELETALLQIKSGPPAPTDD